MPPAANPVPGVNIGPYTGFPTAVGLHRGILYVRDLFCNGARSGHNGVNFGFHQEPATGTPTNPNFDGSFIDFRLAPVVTLARISATPFPPDLSTQNQNSALNPLVDRGLSAASWTMANGLTGAPPGILLPSSDPNFQRYAFDNWQWDMEGFGNPRIFDHSKYPNFFSGPDLTHTIDLGADELGELIIAGYRAGTTNFQSGSGSGYLPPGVTAMDNKYAWYIGPRGDAQGNGVGALTSNDTPALRSYFWGVDLLNSILIRRPNIQYQTTGVRVPLYSPPTVATGRYRPWRFLSKTAVGTCTIPSQLGTPTWYLPTIADITPHLPPDAHPWWHSFFAPLPSNAIWQPCLSPYNFLLYFDPTTNRINPPGTYGGGALSTGLTFQYLDMLRLLVPTLPLNTTDFPKLGQVPTTSLQIPTVDGFDIWCLGFNLQGQPQQRVSRILWRNTLDDGVGPGPKELLGVRFSVEHGKGETGYNGSFWSGDNSNLQSFLVFVQ